MRFLRDLISAQREIARLRRALTSAATMVESEDCSCMIDSFNANGVVLTNRYGHDKFLSTQEVTRILRERATMIRLMAAGEITV